MFVIMRTIGSILVGIVAVSGCSSQDKPVVSRLPLKAEQLSVYRGFLDKFSSLHFRNLTSRDFHWDDPVYVELMWKISMNPPTRLTILALKLRKEPT